MIYSESGRHFHLGPPREQIERRPASYDEILCHTKFGDGYEQVWVGALSAVDMAWSDAEQEAYQRGREFAIYVRKRNEGKVPLLKGTRCHPRAQLLLMLAMRSQDVT